MDTALLVLRVVLSLGLVLGVMWLVARRVGRPSASRGVALDVVGRRSLGRRAGVAVVDVEGRRLVLGVSDTGVRLVADLGRVPAEPVPPVRALAPRPGRTAPSDFATVLAAHGADGAPRPVVPAATAARSAAGARGAVPGRNESGARTAPGGRAVAGTREAPGARAAAGTREVARAREAAGTREVARAREVAPATAERQTVPDAPTAPAGRRRPAHRGEPAPARRAAARVVAPPRHPGNPLAGSVLDRATWTRARAVLTGWTAGP